MIASIPRRPDNIYFCTNSDQTNSRLRCHDGPRFKARVLTHLGENAEATDTLNVGLIDPTLSMYPANLYIGRQQYLRESVISSTTSVSSYNAVSAQQRYNYGHLLLEARRAACDRNEEYAQEALEQGQCDDTLIDRVFPNN